MAWNPDPRPGQTIIAVKRVWSDGIEEELSIVDCHSVVMVNQSGNVLLSIVEGKPLDSGQGWGEPAEPEKRR